MTLVARSAAAEAPRGLWIDLATLHHVMTGRLKGLATPTADGPETWILVVWPE